MPHTRVYGGTFFVTILHSAITAQSQIDTQGIITTFLPIHTSFPIKGGSF